MRFDEAVSDWPPYNAWVQAYEHTPAPILDVDKWVLVGASLIPERDESPEHVFMEAKTPEGQSLRNVVLRTAELSASRILFHLEEKVGQTLGQIGQDELTS